MREVNKIPCLYYLYLHSKIWEMSQTHLIQEKELRKYLFQWKIPDKMRPLIIKELILLGLLENDKQYVLKIKRPVFSEEGLNEYYERLGLF